MPHLYVAVSDLKSAHYINKASNLILIPALLGKVADPVKKTETKVEG